jgi:hypothetical protein
VNLPVARRSPVVAVIAVALFLATCRTLQRSRGPLHVELRTDSTEIGVHVGGEMYAANIGFVFVNTTGGPVSLSGCGGPPMPELEKLVNGKWMVAYSSIYPACLSLPDFSLPDGATYRNEVRFVAAARGTRTFPQLEFDSVNGVYRLRWGLREGTGLRSPADLANPPKGRPVEAISNQFRMTIR